MNLGTIYSQTGSINLFTLSGSIVDGLNHDYANIAAGTAINLTANGGDIGETGVDFLDMDLSSSAVIKATATGDVNLREVLGNMNVHVIEAGGDVSLWSDLAIIDAMDADGSVVGAALVGNDDSLVMADIIAEDVTLYSDKLTIGVSGNDLDIDSNAGTDAGDGVLISYSAQNTYLIETFGDLFLQTVGAGDAGSAGGTYTAFILGAKAIFNGNANATATNVSSGKVRLFSAGDIGAENKRLQTTVGFLEGNSVGGNVWITNTGALQVGGVSSDGDGVIATGSVSLIANSPITVIENITALDGDVTLIANEDGAGDNNADDIVVNENILITAVYREYYRPRW